MPNCNTWKTLPRNHCHYSDNQWRNSWSYTRVQMPTFVTVGPKPLQTCQHWYHEHQYPNLSQDDGCNYSRRNLGPCRYAHEPIETCTLIENCPSSLNVTNVKDILLGPGDDHQAYQIEIPGGQAPDSPKRCIVRFVNNGKIGADVGRKKCELCCMQSQHNLTCITLPPYSPIDTRTTGILNKHASMVLGMQRCDHLPAATTIQNAWWVYQKSRISALIDTIGLRVGVQDVPDDLMLMIVSHIFPVSRLHDLLTPCLRLLPLPRQRRGPQHGG